MNFRSKEAVELFHSIASCLGTSRLAVRRSAALALLNIPERLVFEADEYMFTLLPTIGQVVVLAGSADVLPHTREQSFSRVSRTPSPV